MVGFKGNKVNEKNKEKQVVIRKKVEKQIRINLKVIIDHIEKIFFYSSINVQVENVSDKVEKRDTENDKDYYIGTKSNIRGKLGYKNHEVYLKIGKKVSIVQIVRIIKIFIKVIIQLVIH